MRLLRGGNEVEVKRIAKGINTDCQHEMVPPVYSKPLKYFNKAKSFKTLPFSLFSLSWQEILAKYYPAIRSKMLFLV